MRTIDSVKSGQPNRQADEQTDRELSVVAGGAHKSTPRPFVFIKHYDKASPVLA